MSKNLLSENPETEAPAGLDRLFRVLSGVFFGIAVVALLVTVYVNTADDLLVPALLSPLLFLSIGAGVGCGMLFRTFWKRGENVSPLNYFFKIGFSVLVLLTVLVSFFVSLSSLPK